MQKLWVRRIIYLGATLFLCTGISFFVYGNSPFGSISSLPVYYGSISVIDCINSGRAAFLNCHAMGIPHGSMFVQGAPYFYLGAFINLFIGNAIDSIPYVNLFFLLVAFYGFVAVCTRLGAHFLIANFIAAIYLVSPFLIGHVNEYSTTGLCFAIIPFAILLDLILIDMISLPSNNNWRSIFGYVFGYVFFRLCFLFLDGYAFLFSLLVTVTLSFCLILARKNIYSILVRPPSVFHKPIIAVVVIFLSNVLAVLAYKTFILGGGDYAGMPADFYRGQGVDLITLIWPSDEYYFANKLGLAAQFSKLDFFGDGSNISYNYLGLLAIMGPLVFLKKFKSINYDWKLYGLLMGLLMAFFLSLGPSLKINDHVKVKESGIITFNNYLMPKGVATLDFGIDRLFTRTPGIKNVRAVYRWNHVVRMILLILATLLLTVMFTRNRKLAYCMMAVVLIDNFPSAFANTEGYKARYSQFEKFNSDVIEPLKRDLLPNEKVFYVSFENDYLADYLSIKTNTYSYNLGGDKAIILAAEEWPKQIVNFRQEKNIQQSLEELLQQKFADVLVIPFFNLRWDSYAWPPSPQKIASISMASRESYSFLLKGRYKVKCTDFYCTIRSNLRGPHAIEK